MIYYYTSNTPPDMDILEGAIRSSSFQLAYDHLRWDAEDMHLKIYLTRDLTGAEKTELDIMVAAV